MDLMQEQEMFHIAGHGAADDIDPARSCLIMGTLDQDRERRV